MRAGRQGSGTGRGPALPGLVALWLLIAGCAEPPPVSESLLERVTTEQVVVSSGGSEAGVVVARVPRGFFGNTRPPMLGRALMERDFSGEPSACVISEDLWRRFGAGASDATLKVGDAALEVVGVMPADFDIPAGADVWIPGEATAP